MYITHKQRFIEPHILYVSTDDIFVVYLGVDGQAYIASKSSLLEVENDSINAELRGVNLVQIPISTRYAIDNHEVSEHTFKNVQRLLYIDFGEWYGTFIKMKKGVGDSREDYWYKVYGRSFDRLRKTMEIINCRNDNNMITNIPKIVDYKYIAENGVTIIKWSDNTSTTVTCDTKTADQYTGFVTAIAKKAFGNGGKMLSEWDRLVIKPIEDAKKAEEKAKIEAEKKAKEDKIHAEAKAKRDAKKAERKRKRDIEIRAKQIADEYYAQELTGEAEKLAVKKYGVPKSYLDNRKGNCDNCNCNEFDIMDDENITD